MADGTGWPPERIARASMPHAGSGDALGTRQQPLTLDRFAAIDAELLLVPLAT